MTQSLLVAITLRMGSARVATTNAARRAPLRIAGLLHDGMAGLTVAMVSIPKTMAFATVAGLPPVMGLYSAVVMELVSATISRSSRLVVGPTIAASTITFAILSTVVAGHSERWPAAAGALAVLTGLFILAGVLLNVGRFLRFVSRSVVIGLMAGAAILIIGSQLTAILGIPSIRESMLARILWYTIENIPNAHLPSLLMAVGTFGLVLLFGHVSKRFPGAFLALVISGLAFWLLERSGVHSGLRTIGTLDWEWPTSLTPWYDGPYSTDFIVGAAALALVGMIQTLTIVKAMALRSHEPVSTQRELLAVGLANCAGGLLNGYPGSGSFARSALSDLAGSESKASSVVSALSTVAIVAAGATLTNYLTYAAIAGLLLATVITMVDWREFVQIMVHDRYDRVVLGTTIAGVFVMPIHWAILLGLAVSIAIFLHRVSQLHLVEMVAGTGRHFLEHTIDGQSGRSAVTMLQLEGALFFAHADELAAQLRTILGRGPRVLVLRMRRTKQIDFSVIAALDHVFREYLDRGGHVVICGLTPELRTTLRESPLGRTIQPEYMLGTTREIFGSAHLAIGLAESIAQFDPRDERPMYRQFEPARSA